VLSGAVHVEHVPANLAALRLAVPADSLGRLRALAVSPAEYWARRAASVWT
jgi:hypothetical protein